MYLISGCYSIPIDKRGKEADDMLEERLDINAPKLQVFLPAVDTGRAQKFSHLFHPPQTLASDDVQIFLGPAARRHGKAACRRRQFPQEEARL